MQVVNAVMQLRSSITEHPQKYFVIFKVPYKEIRPNLFFFFFSFFSC